jgi:hypothetical protein
MDWNLWTLVNQKVKAEKSAFTPLKIKSKRAAPTKNAYGKFA